MMRLLTGEFLLDVNVLIALIFQDHEHHTRAARFVADVERFYTCPITQGGFLRFATRPYKESSGAEQLPRLTVAAAQLKLKELSAVEGHGFLADDLFFTDLSLRSITGHNQWTDAYLLQLASHHELRFASFDGRMASLDTSPQRTFFTVP